MLLAAWGVFVHLNRGAEEMEPESMAAAKQEDVEVQQRESGDATPGGELGDDRGRRRLPKNSVMRRTRACCVRADELGHDDASVESVAEAVSGHTVDNIGTI